MSNPLITWLDNDGNYRSTAPAYNDKARPDDETDDQFIQRIIGKLKVQYSLASDHEFHIVEKEDQLARLAELEGNTFRYGGVDTGHPGAWEMDTDGRPKIDMPKARVVHRDHIREVRNVELEKLDVPYMRAVEAADTDEQTNISNQKQILRDLPQTFDLDGYTTPATLKDAWPDELEYRSLEAALENL
jgi:hypothetical protein